MVFTKIMVKNSNLSVVPYLSTVSFNLGFGYLFGVIMWYSKVKGGFCQIVIWN